MSTSGFKPDRFRGERLGVEAFRILEQEALLDAGTAKRFRQYPTLTLALTFLAPGQLRDYAEALAADTAELLRPCWPT